MSQPTLIQLSAIFFINNLSTILSPELTNKCMNVQTWADADAEDLPTLPWTDADSTPFAVKPLELSGNKKTHFNLESINGLPSVSFH